MHSLNELTAIILAGGLGTRLRSVVADRPKVLAEVCGRPFLSHLLDQVEASGIRRVILCTGYLGEQVRAAFGESYGEMSLAYSQEKEPLGTAGALNLAIPLLKTETALVMNGDSYCDAKLTELYKIHKSRKAEGTILLVEMPDTERFGQVLFDDAGAIVSFTEKGSHTGAGWINAGIYILNRSVLVTIPEGRAVSLERETFPFWIGRGLYGHQNKGRFLDIGTPESYSIAERFFASRV